MTNLIDTAIFYLTVAAAVLLACIGPFAIPLIAETYVTGLGTVLIVPCLLGCPWLACHLPLITFGGR
jgi:hypothetical protein